MGWILVSSDKELEHLCSNRTYKHITRVQKNIFILRKFLVRMREKIRKFNAKFWAKFCMHYVTDKFTNTGNLWPYWAVVRPNFGPKKWIYFKSRNLVHFWIRGLNPPIQITWADSDWGTKTNPDITYPTI